MGSEQKFRLLFIAIFTLIISISGYYRRKARSSGEAISRSEEGILFLLLRLVFAAPLYLPILAYIVNPDWMAWSSMPLPLWLRWMGAAIGLGQVPLIYWVMTTLGSNVSETVLTKESHVLVTHGPYRWVRHPLYSVATVTFIALSLLAANWFIGSVALLAITIMLLVVIPREEAHLMEKFGAEYREYMKRTGKLLPRFRLSK